MILIVGTQGENHMIYGQDGFKKSQITRLETQGVGLRLTRNRVIFVRSPSPAIYAPTFEICKAETETNQF